MSEKDTLRALIVLARFSDGRDNPECECDGGGWPDTSTVPPSWAADSLLEDTTDPEIVGSITHFYDVMSNGQHLLMGRTYPEIITLDSTIQYYDTTFVFEAGQYAARDVLYKVADSLANFDYDDDGILDYCFIDFRAAVDTLLAYRINKYESGGDTLRWSGISLLLPTASETIGGVTVLEESGSLLTNGTSCGSNARTNFNRWLTSAVCAHEYGHDLYYVGGLFGGDHTGPVVKGYDLMGGGREVIGYAKYKLGWVDPIELDSTVADGDTTIVLPTSTEKGDSSIAILRTHVDGTNEQYFVLEARCIHPGNPCSQASRRLRVSCTKEVQDEEGTTRRYEYEGGSFVYVLA